MERSTKWALPLTGMFALIILGVCATTSRAGGACDMVFPPPQGVDVPDPFFVDANGDGIDGMACGPVFVAMSGNDSNPGTMDAPMRSIQAAILAAAALTPTRDVYVSIGVYNESIVLRSGVDVYGGYNAADGWSRAASNSVTIVGFGVGVYAMNLHELTTLDLLNVFSTTPPGFGESSIAVYARNNSAPMNVRDVFIRPGHGLDGANGFNGLPGEQGGNGQPGGIGSCDNENAPGMGGQGGPSTVGNNHHGGMGGRGGWASSFMFNGEPGFNAVGGAQGGSPGPGGNPGGHGGGGQLGVNGINGQNGINGVGYFASGANGQIGTHGFGGGGGGGGGGQFGPFVNNGSGNGGGGGGGGGARGQITGSGGTYGGSSFGVVAIDVDFGAFDSSFELGNGGNGGNGGAGGLGGLGGAGGPGATFCSGEIGRGGNGGNGGRGGNAGHGGAGVGGHSIGVFSVSALRSTITIDNTTFDLGSAGDGGNSWMGAAASGVSDDVVFAGVEPPLTLSGAPFGVHARIWTEMNTVSAPFPALVADYDPNSVYTIEILAQPANGVALYKGGLTYSPMANFTGVDFFPIRVVRSGTGASAEGFAVVHVLGVPVDCTGDINGDGVVDFTDFSLLLANYGNDCN